MDHHMEELLGNMKDGFFKDAYFSIFDSICNLLQKNLNEKLDGFNFKNAIGESDSATADLENENKAGKQQNTLEASPKSKSIFTRHKSNKSSELNIMPTEKIIRNSTPKKSKNLVELKMPKSYDFSVINSPGGSSIKKEGHKIDLERIQNNGNHKHSNGINETSPPGNANRNLHTDSKPRKFKIGPQPSILNNLWQDHLNLKKQILKNSFHEHNLDLTKKLNDSKQKSSSKDHSGESKSRDKEIEKSSVLPYYLPRIVYKPESNNGLKNVNLSMDHAGKKKHEQEKHLGPILRDRSFDIAYQRNVDTWLRIHKLSHHRERSADVQKSPPQKQMKLDLEFNKRTNFPRISKEKKKSSPPPYLHQKHL